MNEPFTSRVLARFLRALSSGQQIRSDLEIVKNKLDQTEKKLGLVVRHIEEIRRDMSRAREFIGDDGTMAHVEGIIKDAADGATLFNPKNLAVLRTVDDTGLAAILNVIEPGFIQNAMRMLPPEKLAQVKTIVKDFEVEHDPTDDL